MSRPKSATVQLKLRMKEPLRAQIAQSAKEKGVSLNAEILSRLNHTAFAEGLVDDFTINLLRHVIRCACASGPTMKIKLSPLSPCGLAE